MGKRIISAMVMLAMLCSSVPAMAAEEGAEAQTELQTTQETQAEEASSEAGEDSTSETGTSEGANGEASQQEQAETSAEDADDSLSEALSETSSFAFPDIEGHWAESYLQQAVSLGLLTGSGGYILPNQEVKVSEAITILNRALGAQTSASISTMPNLDKNAWYASEIAKACYLGLVDVTDTRTFAVSATREEAFVLIGRAFSYGEADTDTSVLEKFSDAGSLTGEARNVTAALVQAGVVEGNAYGELRPDGALTRAAFVTMLLRIAGNYPTEVDNLATVSGGAIIRTAQAELTSNPNGDRIFATNTQAVSLSNVTAADRIVFKGMDRVAVTVQDNSILSYLALDPAGSANVTLDDTSNVSTLVVAGTGGAVTLSGEVGVIQITASGRTINLSGMEASKIVVSGSDNTIVMNGAVRNVKLLNGAKNTSLTLSSDVVNIAIAARDCKIFGDVSAQSVSVTAVGCSVAPQTENYTESIDKGLSGISLNMGVPTKVTAGGALTTQITLSGISENKVGVAQWYKNGVKIDGYRNESFAISSDTVSRVITEFAFTKDMDTEVTMGFELLYENPSSGETERLYVEKTVPIENYSDEWYYQRDAERVLSLVSSTYSGNYTMKYAVDNDYQSYEKEVFVNAKGYSSNSDYLVWINRGMQHVNVFTGSKDNWKLQKSFLVGTGASGSQTPTGITTLSYKLAAGWTTSTYTVKPVVGFYPGTGYAFHSRLFYPNTTTLLDGSIGYPISHGCVRMYDADVQWIYDNVPIGSTVVIF